MSAIYTIPSYLPKDLRGHVEPLIKYDQLRKAVYPLERLVSSLVMKEVWDSLVTLCLSKTTCELESKAFDAQPLIDFLVFVNSHVSLSGKVDDYITEPSDNVQREAYQSIQKDLESIISTLESLSEVKTPNSNNSKQDNPKTTLFRKGNIENGWRILEQALHRSEITILKSKVIAEPKQFTQLIFDLNRFDEIANLQDLLENMTFAAIAASHAKDSNLPKRRNTPKAKTNKFIKDLSDYFMGHFSQPLDDLVAITTNVAFDFSDDRVTQDMVYKLRHPSKSKNKSKPAK